MNDNNKQLRAALRHNNQRISDSLKRQVAAILKDRKAEREWQSVARPDSILQRHNRSVK